MLACVSNVSNPSELRTLIKELGLAGYIDLVGACLFPGMMIVPNPVLQVPDGAGCVEGACWTRVCFELVVIRKHNLLPECPGRSEAHLDGLDGPAFLVELYE